MILRETTSKLIFILITTFQVVRLEESRVYDTSEWIPVENGSRKGREAEQKMEDRVMNVPYGAPFFREIKPRFNRNTNQFFDRPLSYALPPRYLPKRQQSYSNINLQSLPNEHRQQLNERENTRLQYYTPQQQQLPFLGPAVGNQFQAPQRQPFVQNVNRQNYKEFPQPLLLPAGTQYFGDAQQFLRQPLFNAPPPPLQNPPGNPNFYQQNFKNSQYRPQLQLPPPQYIQGNNSASFEGLVFEANQPNQVPIPSSLTTPLSNQTPPGALPKPENPKDNVQLLYVPIESLNQKNPQNPFALQNNQPTQQVVFPQNLPNPQVLPQFNQQPYQFLPTPSFQPDTPLHHQQQQLQSIQNDFARQALESLKLQLQLESNQENLPSQSSVTATPSSYTTTTTAAPITTTTPASTVSKRKSHQPPLAVYMGGDGQINISDVLELLKNAKTISVQDEVGPDSPQVFVGPSNLEAPEGYHRFDLPYLNNIDSNRIERKVDQFPFFVAPLTYKAPEGYSKIPLPAPHVGSVVVSQKEKLHSKNENAFSGVLPKPAITDTFYQPYNPNKVHSTKVEKEHYHSPSRQRTNFNSYRKPVTTTTTLKYPSTLRPDPLGQTINQFELEQINHQFVPQFADHNYSEFYLNNDEPPNKPVQDYDPSQIHNYSEHFSEVEQPSPTTTVAPIITTQRIPRPTQKIADSTQSNTNKQKYTVLEEFSINRKPDTATRSYFKNTVPVAQPLQADSSFLPTQRPEYHQQQVEVVSQKQTIPDNSQSFLQLNNGQYVPFNENVYRLFPQTQQQEITPAPIKLLDNPTTDSSQSYNVNSDVKNYYGSQNQNEEFKIPEKNPPKDNLYRLFPQSQQQEVTQVPIKLLDNPTTASSQSYNVNSGGKNYYDSQDQNEEFKIPEKLPPINPNLHNLINGLQDQSLRALLIPASIAPTTEEASYFKQRQRQPQQQPEQQPQQYETVGVPQLISTPEVEVTPNSVYTLTSTTTTTTTTESPESTTPYKRQRGRQRARITTTTDSPPSRAPARTRKPVSRTRTQTRYHPEQQQDDSYSPTRHSSASSNRNNEDYGTKASRTQQRFRSRGRPTEEVTEKTSTTPYEIETASRSSQLHISTASYHQPQSYMQFEQPIEHATYNREVTVNNDNTVPSTERHFLQETVVKQADINQAAPQMSIDVVINHPVTEQRLVESTPILHNSVNSQFLHENVKSTTELHSTTEQNVVSSTRSHYRGRVRSKSKKRTTTPAPVETVEYVSPETKPPQEEKREEFYGFFRKPNFHRPSTLANSPKLYSATYSASTTNVPTYSSNDRKSAINFQNQENEQSTAVHLVSSTTSRAEFVPKIRPAFSSTLALPLEDQNIDQESVTEAHASTSRRYTIYTTTQPSTLGAKTKIRGRMRLPSKKYGSRGKTHFQPPSGIKAASAEDDVAGGNYPEQFLQMQKVPTERPKFQITLDPEDAETNDQEPHSSIYVPQVHRNIYHNDKDSYSKHSTASAPKYITLTRKMMESQEQSEEIVVSTSPISTIHNGKHENVMESSSEDGNSPKPHRRGVWRLIKQRPIDSLDTAESQNVAGIFANAVSLDKKTPIYGKSNDNSKVMIVNSVPYYKDEKMAFNSNIQKIKLNTSTTNAKLLETTTETIPSTTQQEESMLESLFDMFKISSDSSEEDFLAPETETKPLDTIANTTFEITTQSASNILTETPLTTINIAEEINKQEIIGDDATTTVSNVLNEPKGGTLSEDLELPQETQTEADMMKTSLSTEVSHETKICYRGKCIKTEGAEDDAV